MKGVVDVSVPVHLKHKPIYAINDYEAIDGTYKSASDVKGLSIGKAQWSDKRFVAAVKVWRRKNGRWSRQSEETTVTRALDMATLVVKVMGSACKGQAITPINTIHSTVTVDAMTTDAALISELEHFLQSNRSDIDAHLDVLYEVLKAYKE